MMSRLPATAGVVRTTPPGPPNAPNKGVWSALDKATGQILWQTPTPDDAIPGLGSAIGAVTVANGVAYACTFAGTHVALDASNGSILWHQPPAPNPDYVPNVPGSIPVELCGAGAAVSRGTVYWGTGYSQIALQPVTSGRLTAYGLAK